jgi:hypothetical protein
MTSSRSLLLLCAAIAALPGAVLARAPKPPAEVVAAAQAMTHLDDPPPGYVDVPAGMIRPIKISPSAKPDWLIDGDKADGLAGLCGTGGCQSQIWVAGADGHYRRVFSDQVRVHVFRWLPGHKVTWLLVDYHGSVCGLAGVQACPWAYEWRQDENGRGYLGASVRFASKAVWRPGPLPQALDPLTEDDPALVPAVIRALVERNAAACKAHGRDMPREGLVNRLPDLNGDGIDDWAFDGDFLVCDAPAPDNDSSGQAAAALNSEDPCGYLECATVIWLSHRMPDGKVEWQPVDKAPNTSYALKFTPHGVGGVIALSDRPGVKPDDADACDISTLANCVKTPISLSPKP